MNSATAEKKDSVNVKLVAVAKDEAAYLPLWIFHHLQAGFSSIDIYVNNTSDNTWEVAKNLSSLPSVRFLDADNAFRENSQNPQVYVYKNAYQELDRSSVNYLMFLDIDEFFFSVRGVFDIQAEIQRLNFPSAVNINWFNEYLDEEFASVYKQRISGSTHRLLKTVFKVEEPVEGIRLHNVNIPNGNYVFPNGQRWDFEAFGPARNVMPKDVFSTEPMDLFILHRKFRSRKEYMSLLLRGNPGSVKMNGVEFKDNRSGYWVTGPTMRTIEYSVSDMSYMQGQYEKFIGEYSLAGIIEEAKSYVLGRYELSVKKLKAMTVEDYNCCSFDI